MFKEKTPIKIKHKIRLNQSYVKFSKQRSQGSPSLLTINTKQQQQKIEHTAAVTITNTTTDIMYITAAKTRFD